MSFDRKEMKNQAKDLVDQAAYSPKKLTTIHSGVFLGLSLVISLIGIAIDRGIAGTGGLSGIQTRNLLQTIQTMLNLVYTVAQPFWVIGLGYAFLRIVRKENAQPQSLLRGFHRFGPVLRLNLLKLGLMVAAAFPCAYIGSYVGLLLSNDMYTVLEPVVAELRENPSADAYALVSQLPMDQLLAAMWLPLIIVGIAYGGIVFYFSYRFRFANYLILDDPKIGAIAALRNSFHMTKGLFGKLFMLDLSFLWYHGLQALIAAFAFADVLLTYAGITLPIANAYASILSYCIYGGLTLLMDYTLRPRVEATYALVYDNCRNQVYFPYKL